MVMTKDSFTGEEKWDRIVLAYLIVRIIICSTYVIINAVQTFYEFRILMKSNKKFTPSPRLLTFICVTLAPLMRVFSVGFFIEQHDYTGTGLFFMFGNWCICFIFASWGYISCIWVQIFYMFYISKEISFKNSRRIWVITNITCFLIFIFTIVITIVSSVWTPAMASLFSTIEFILVMLGLGGFIGINLILLWRHMKQAKNLLQDNEKNERTTNRIKRLALSLFLLVVVLVSRELWLVLAKPAFDSNIRHVSSFFTMLIEYYQMTVVMLGMSNSPINYLLFKPVNTRRGYGSESKNSTNNNKTSGTTNTSNNTGNINYANQYSGNTNSSSSNSISVNIEMDSKEYHS